MDLRDRLAVQRTILANQRTLLAFFSASLALVISGVTLIRFFNSPAICGFGFLLLPAAVILLVLGIRNYRLHKQKIEAASK